MIKDLMHFFSGVREEFSRVVWPTKVELLGTTAIVLVLVIFFAVYVGGIDFILSTLASRIF
jgi:preprotein translocase subunit SecE